MLKKSDLAKQLDLVVKQEIKNYNDSLNFVLQSLRDLKSNIEIVQNESLLKYTSSHSERCKLSSLLNEKTSVIDYKINEINSFIRDLQSYNYEYELKSADSFDYIFKKLEEFHLIQEKSLSQSEKIEELEEKVNRYCRIHDDNLVDLNMRIKKDMLKMKEEILSIPSDFVEEKKDMENKLNSHVIDVEGVLREIRLAKKEMYIMEKKIENLYTLLNRKQVEK